MAELATYLDLNVCAKSINLHVWQRALLHGLDSPVGLSCLGVTFAPTRMSLRLFGRLNAIIGFSGKMGLSFVFVSIVCQCLSMMSFFLGRSGWYVTTKGILDCVTFNLYFRILCICMLPALAMALSTFSLL